MATGGIVRQTDHELVKDIDMALRFALHLRHHIATDEDEEEEPSGWEATLTVTRWPWEPGEEESVGMNFTIKTPIVAMELVRRWVARLNLVLVTQLLDIFSTERPDQYQLKFNKILSEIDDQLTELDK